MPAILTCLICKEPAQEAQLCHDHWKKFRERLRKLPLKEIPNQNEMMAFERLSFVSEELLARVDALRALLIRVLDRYDVGETVDRILEADIRAAVAW